MSAVLGSGDGLMTTTTQAPVTKRLVAHFTIPGEPVSKARARVTSHGTFTPAKTREAEKAVVSAFCNQVLKNYDLSLDPTLKYELRCEFNNGTKRARDTDNMLKLVQDALNGWAYHDDSQIFDLSASKRFVPKADARTEVWLYVLEVTEGTA
jgi:Holliday junction resolvase RusA-like endonuclease